MVSLVVIWEPLVPSIAETGPVKSRQVAHHRSAAPRREALPQGLGRGILGAALLCLAFASAGCSTLGTPDDQLITGSVRPHATPVSAPLPQGAAPKGIAEPDWIEAKAALDQALTSRDKDTSIPWENKASGASGTATPIGPERGGCRDFMISVVDAKAGDRWVQGEACRARSGFVLNQVRILGRA
ncbi:RT0821/Lpp0805 family surface protein [Xanthobacter pseudotagetidis]|uniref:RT0821/Lpp0805 family surface protein n=1 Tax=Xanthobacter pseudotagetidis TaxID=3119911 RepID=UPI003726890C